MREVSSQELVDLLNASEPAAVEEAWDVFVCRHSRLIMNAVRQTAASYDGTMDRYTFVLEQLRKDEFRRLRTYDPERGSRLSTWLVVVAQRLCVDLERRRFGRSKNPNGETSEQTDVRRRLAGLIAARIDVTEVQDPTAIDPEARVVLAERRNALDEAVRSLSNRDRLLLSLKYEDGASAAQIAAARGHSPPFHVYRRLNRVLRALRRALGERDFQERYG